MTLLMLVLGCGGGGYLASGPQPPTVNVTGTWSGLEFLRYLVPGISFLSNRRVNLLVQILGA